MVRSIRLSRGKRLVRKTKTKTYKRSLIRKTFKRKSFKRKSLKRKSLKRKSLKRKSLRKRLIRGGNPLKDVLRALFEGTIVPLQAFFKSNRRNIKMKKSENYFGFGINTFNDIIFQTDEPYYLNTFGAVYRLKNPENECRTHFEHFVLLRLGIVNENDVPDVIPKTKSHRWGRFFGKSIFELRSVGVQAIHNDGTSLQTHINERPWEIPSNIPGGDQRTRLVSSICEGNEGIDYVYIGSTKHATGFDYYLFKNKRAGRKCANVAWPLFCSKKGGPYSHSVHTYEKYATRNNSDRRYCKNGVRGCSEEEEQRADSPARKNSISFSSEKDIDAELDKKIYEFMYKNIVSLSGMKLVARNLFGTWGQNVWEVTDSDDLTNLAGLGITSLEIVQINGWVYKYEIIFTNSRNGLFKFIDGKGHVYTNRTVEKNVLHSIKYNSDNHYIVKVKREE